MFVSVPNCASIFIVPGISTQTQVISSKFLSINSARVKLKIYESI